MYYYVNDWFITEKHNLIKKIILVTENNLVSL